MAHKIGVVFLVTIAAALATYNPYSPYPPANARGPTQPSRSTSTYNRAQDFRAAGRSPGYGSALSSTRSYASKQGKVNGNGGPGIYGISGSGQYNGGSRPSAPVYGGPAPSAPTPYGSVGGGYYAGPSPATNGYSGSAYGGPYDDLAQPSAEDPDADSIVGVAGADYPAYTEVPQTSFSCASHQFPGLYADPEAQCQVFHICQEDGRHDSFLCPIGSIFNQEHFVCEWWYNVDCSIATSLYSLNADLYRDSVRYSAVTSYATAVSNNFYGPSGGARAYAPAPANGNGGAYAPGRAAARPLASAY